MSVALFLATAVLAITVIVLSLLGLAYLAHRHNQTISFKVVAGGGLALALICAALLLHSDVVEAIPELVRTSVVAAAYLSAAFFLLTILDTLIIGEWFIARKGRYIPDAVRNLLLGAEVVVAAVIILRLVMNVNVVALVALPTVAAAVVGVALKDTLARLFAGIELGRIVKEGDWIATLSREGMVTHIGLEHITLTTREHDSVSLPNDTVIQAGVTNYSRPSTTHMCSILVEAAYRTSPSQVCAILVDLASAVEGVLSEPKAVAMVTAFNESAIQYRLKFPIGDYARYPQIESAVRTYVWNAFVRTGIEIPFPQRVVHQGAESEEVKHQMSADQLAGHLRTVDFLAGLDPKQIEVVAQGARIEQFLSGERVVRQDESGDELYIILSGSADVQIEQNDLHSVVNHLSPGQFFGEMSLLTGEPRSATVVATSCLRVIVVGKESLIRVAKEDHRVIEQIGETVARRHVSTAAAKRQLSRDASLATGLMQARSLIERIQNFFWGRAKA